MQKHVHRKTRTQIAHIFALGDFICATERLYRGVFTEATVLDTESQGTVIQDSLVTQIDVTLTEVNIPLETKSNISSQNKDTINNISSKSNITNKNCETPQKKTICVK